MRPRFANRGSSRPSVWHRPARLYFNEAPIRESGKWASRAVSPRTSIHFNEAPIRESGKYTISDAPPLRKDTSMRPRFANRGSRLAVPNGLRIVVTSMRPRFANRGSQVSPALHSPALLTSMRPRFANRGSAPCPTTSSTATTYFNEAPIRESGKSGGSTETSAGSGTSMRPRFANRGSALVSAIAVGENDTSMRPRFANRGSCVSGSDRSEVLSTSMRPRFANRGSSREAPVGEAPCWTSMRPRFANRGSTPSRRETRFRHPHFNEAPIRESGKCGNRSRSRYRDIALQ